MLLELQAGYDLRAKLARARGSFAPGASALTVAELRLLPMLSTHLSFPEIAQEIFLSPNTVRSQAMAIYHKLGASSRSQAVARSRDVAQPGPASWDYWKDEDSSSNPRSDAVHPGSGGGI